MLDINVCADPFSITDKQSLGVQYIFETILRLSLFYCGRTYQLERVLVKKVLRTKIKLLVKIKLHKKKFLYGEG
jgi:hypothetical protein